MRVRAGARLAGPIWNPCEGRRPGTCLLPGGRGGGESKACATSPLFVLFNQEGNTEEFGKIRRLESESKASTGDTSVASISPGGTSWTQWSPLLHQGIIPSWISSSYRLHPHVPTPPVPQPAVWVIGLAPWRVSEEVTESGRPRARRAGLFFKAEEY